MKGWQAGTSSVVLQSVSDNDGGSWSSTTLQFPGAGAAIQIWYSLNHPGGSTTVIATFTGGTALGIVANLSEWRGLSGLESSAGTTGSSTTPATGSVGTMHAGDLVIGAAAQQGKLTIIAGPTDSFTGLTDAVTSGGSGNINAMSAYQLESASGPYSTSWTMSGSSTWAGSIAAFSTRSNPSPTSNPTPTSTSAPTPSPFLPDG